MTHNVQDISCTIRPAGGTTYLWWRLGLKSLSLAEALCELFEAAGTFM